MRACTPWFLSASALTSAIAVWPALAAEIDQIPDFSGLWGRNSLTSEPPSSGPGPVVNMPRGPDGVRNFRIMAGDYTNPILKPAAAAQIKRLGEISLGACLSSHWSRRRESDSLRSYEQG